MEKHGENKYQRRSGYIFYATAALAIGVCLAGVAGAIVPVSSSEPEIEEPPISVTQPVDTSSANAVPIVWTPRADDVNLLAKVIWGEARGVADVNEQEAVAWCILNRLDSGRFGSTLLEVVSAPHQFVGYSEDNPVVAEFEYLARGVLQTWHAGYREDDDLPFNYLYFSECGGFNRFRTCYDVSDSNCQFWN